MTHETEQTSRIPEPIVDYNYVDWIDSLGMSTELRDPDNKRSRVYYDILGNRDCKINDLPGPYAITFNLDPEDNVILSIAARAHPELEAKTVKLPPDFYGLMCERHKDKKDRAALDSGAKDDTDLKAINLRIAANVQKGIAAMDQGLRELGVEPEANDFCDLSHPLFELMVEHFKDHLEKVKRRSVVSVASLEHSDARYCSVYADGLLDTTTSVKINDSYGPYDVRIEPYWLETKVTFTNTQGETFGINLPSDEWFPKIKERLLLIADYKKAQNAVPLDQKVMNRADAVRRTNHNELALELSQKLASQTPTIDVDFTTARNLIGTITDVAERAFPHEIDEAVIPEKQDKAQRRPEAGAGKPGEGAWAERIIPGATNQMSRY